MRENQFLKTKSNKKGFWGQSEAFFRKFKFLALIFVYFLTLVICGICLTLALIPGLALVLKTLEMVQPYGLMVKSLLISISLVLSLLLFIISLITIVPIFNTYILQLPKWLKPFRGNTYSWEAVPWYLHNALIYLVRYTILEFITPSPLNVLFYKAMGMKVGKNVVINSSNISDACLITLGDYVVIGGSAHLLTHYSQKGYLVVSTLSIGSQSTIGLKASVFGDVTIDENCLVSPHSVVLPKTHIKKPDTD